MFTELLRHLYTPTIQLGVRQIEAIAGAIYTRQPGCKLLIFGCGNDSPLWFALNRKGRTVFLENSPEWRNTVLAKAPNLEIHLYTLPDITVMSSMQPENVPDVPPPPVMLEENWDVILIDGPRGDIPDKTPGRALPILWTRQVRNDKTHVFLDDMHRPLEKLHASLHLNISCTISNEKELGKIMGWSIGMSI